MDEGAGKEVCQTHEGQRTEELVNRFIGALGKLVAVSIAAIFTLLWLRVACKSVIVIFNIATSLRRLEELSEPNHG